MGQIFRYNGAEVKKAQLRKKESDKSDRDAFSSQMDRLKQ